MFDPYTVSLKTIKDGWARNGFAAEARGLPESLTLSVRSSKSDPGLVREVIHGDFYDTRTLGRTKPRNLHLFNKYKQEWLALMGGLSVFKDIPGDEGKGLALYNNIIAAAGFTMPGVVVDIGACMGSFSALATTIWPGCTCLAYEAHPGNEPVLTQNARKYGFKAHMGALFSSGDSTVPFAKPEDNGNLVSAGGGSVRAVRSEVTTDVPVIPIERMWEHVGNRAIGFIKIDCEGSEANIFPAIRRMGKMDRVRTVVGEYHGGAKTLAALQEAFADTHFLFSRKCPISAHLGHFFACPLVG